MRPCEACGGSGEVMCPKCYEGILPDGSECVNCERISICVACKGTGRSKTLEPKSENQ